MDKASKTCGKAHKRECWHKGSKSDSGAKHIGKGSGDGKAGRRTIRCKRVPAAATIYPDDIFGVMLFERLPDSGPHAPKESLHGRCGARFFPH